MKNNVSRMTSGAVISCLCRELGLTLDQDDHPLIYHDSVTVGGINISCLRSNPYSIYAKRRVIGVQMEVGKAVRRRVMFEFTGKTAMLDLVKVQTKLDSLKPIAEERRVLHQAALNTREAHDAEIERLEMEHGAKFHGYRFDPKLADILVQGNAPDFTYRFTSTAPLSLAQLEAMIAIARGGI